MFDVLYRTRSTTRAAQALNLTQPSVSNALKRLRELFDDVLFVKTADGMQPTPRAEGIAALIDEGFASLRKCDFRKLKASLDQKLLSAVDAPHGKPRVWRHSQRLAEGLGE